MSVWPLFVDLTKLTRPCSLALTLSRLYTNPHVSSNIEALYARNVLVVVDVEDSVGVSSTSGGESEVDEARAEDVVEDGRTESTILVEDFVDNILERAVSIEHRTESYVLYSPKSEPCPCSGQQPC